MNDLDNLAIKYGTDKFSKHRYTAFYYELLKDKQDSFKKILEIGAGEGQSLRMWRDFFPNAMIYCGEIEDGRIFEDGRIKVIKCDQSKSDDVQLLLNKIGTDIDFVVDDGSHIPGDQVFTCCEIAPKLVGDFIYIIEDVSKEEILDMLKEKLGSDYDYQMVVTRRWTSDNRLIIVRRKNV